LSAGQYYLLPVSLSAEVLEEIVTGSIYRVTGRVPVKKEA
jgi:hypothetical protein